MRIFLSSLLVQAGCLVFTATLSAQAPTPAPQPGAPKNMIGNPGFESGFRRDNLWDGVDTGGSLSGERGALPVLTTGGTISDSSMPISVSLADLNGDGLMDIATMDVLGYLRVFFNAGTKTEPKFTVGELGNLFLSRISPKDPTVPGLANATNANARMGQRIHLADLSRSGKRELVIGNYLGEILLIPNAGSGARPDYRQPSSIASTIIPTMKNSMEKWGNVFAPAIWDWNKDGKDDLLVGEGSYSANSIHLLLNQDSGGKPRFEESYRSVLAYGMGLEQLTPCVIDYNGDGHPDLLVTERTGKVAIYLNSGKPWKAGETLAFDSFLPVGGAKPGTAGQKDPMDAAKNAAGLLSVGGIATIAAADMNGDELFDLVFGKSNGKIALSLNTGTKTEPKFAAPVEIKGDVGTLPFNSPSGWECNFGLDRGNFYGFVSVVKAADDPGAQPFEGVACLKVGYITSPNKIMPAPTQYSPANGENWKQRNANENDPLITSQAPANCFIIAQTGRGSLKPNTHYVFSMRVKGAKVNEASVGIFYEGYKKLSEAKIERGDKGSAKVTKNEVRERNLELIPFTVGSGWAEVKKEFVVKFTEKELQEEPVRTWRTSILFTLSPGQNGGTLYIDDVKLIEKGK